jgi:heme-degrading monooxygenase HmoA
MFVVIYSWKLAAEKEDLFREGWLRVTEAIYRDRGSLGSRLHEGEDDVWVAYAQWPDRDTWERSGRLGAADAEGRRMMEEATLEHFPTFMLTVKEDLLHAEPKST